MVSMSENLISIIDVAAQTGKRKATIFKILKRLNIEPIKRRSSANRGQVISYITNEELRQVLEQIKLKEDFDIDVVESNLGPEALLFEQGVFYLLILEPNHDPGRFKVGFAINLSERLRALRCSAPFAEVVNAWPCKRLWEKTAIECVTVGCDKLHTEVFRTQSMESVVEKCRKFFELMPILPYKI
ncbi:hypothetical protein [Candidatus Competibacter denitrificans]|nr:hypothetical protein [Candidatus Competibacter denitrificans]